jgi:hypothetical protein
MWVSALSGVVICVDLGPFCFLLLFHWWVFFLYLFLSLMVGVRPILEGSITSHPTMYICITKKPRFIMSMWYPSPVAHRVHPDHKRLGLWSACPPWASTLKSKEQQPLVYIRSIVSCDCLLFSTGFFIFSQKKAANGESEGGLTIFFQGFSLQSNQWNRTFCWIFCNSISKVIGTHDWQVGC